METVPSNAVAPGARWLSHSLGELIEWKHYVYIVSLVAHVGFPTRWEN